MSDNRESVSLLARWGVLFGLFFIMLIAVSGLATIINGLDTNLRSAGLAVAAIQDVLLFITPALIYARVFSHSPLKELEMTRTIEWRQCIGVCILFFAAYPALNQVIAWNEMLSFPPSMQGFENILREMENQASQASEVLLGTSSIGGMISGILIIGCLTGLAEELFFRGAIQRSMEESGVNSHIAIWIAAIIFSTLHFQFFGFVPRLLLGAFFGYLLYWSKSIWVSAFAHALNNSIVVVTAYLTQKELITIDVEEIGISTNGFHWMPLVSGVLFIILTVYCKRIFFYPTVSKIKPLKRNIN